MLARQQANTNIGVGLGIALYVCAALLFAKEASPVMGCLALLATWTMFGWGLANYAMGKGHSPFFGIVGFFGCCGLLFLVFLPDKYS